jgi:hypothetical protein
MGYLGKRFQNAIAASLDEGFIEDRLRGIEFLKLHILDCAEAFQRPPVFKDAEWARELYRSRDYNFVWEEFAGWLRANKLEYSFQQTEDDTLLHIGVQLGHNFGEVAEPELSLKSWLENAKNK